MTAIAEVQELMVEALLGKTVAGNNVFTPRTWPTVAGAMPIILVAPGKETKISKGRSVPMFDVFGVVRVTGRIFAKADAGNAGQVAALAAAQTLQRQIEVAVINAYALRSAIQSFAKIETVVQVAKEGDLIFGEVVIDFGLDVFQGPEDFHPTDGDPIDELAIFADLINVYSPTGAFNETPYAGDAVPAPRDRGPDGRAEAVSIVSLPQD